MQLLSNLLEKVSVLALNGNSEVEISAIHFDSRLVQSGDLFVAIVGSASDGHSFIPNVEKQGVAAVVCEKMPAELNPEVCYVLVENSNHTLAQLANAWYGNPSEKLTLVGVTGTNGKTTIATLLYKLTRAYGYKAGLLSTVCNYIDEVAVEATHTTPDPLQLNELLNRMVAAGCEYAFMEVSSHAIDQERITGLEFDGALFTNLTRDHIDYHLTFDNYRDTKKRFFDNLNSDAFAITNKDDKNGMVMLQNTKAKKMTYSLQSLADFKAKVLEEDFAGMLLTVNGQEVFVPLVGRFNVYNLLAVYGAAVSLGFEEKETLRILSTLSAVRGRFEHVRSSKGWTAIVDYAHTPDALTNVISTINEIRKAGQKLITIVGCGGNRDKGKRPMMAREAVAGSDVAILTNDNPRNEEPQDIINDMLAGLTTDEQKDTLVILDRRQAIRTACTMAQSGDIILIAGKGHEDYQIIKGEKTHFDDMEEVQAMC